jgi:hypothetical protein
MTQDNLFDPEVNPEIERLMNADYPIPDPAWDYDTVWLHTMKLQRSIALLSLFLQAQENATPEADERIRLAAITMQESLGAIARLVIRRHSSGDLN